MLDVGIGEEPELIHDLLDFCLQYIIAFADLLLDTGGASGYDRRCTGKHEPDIAAERLRADVFPYQQRLAQHVHARDGRLSTHVCGFTTPIFDQLVDTGADILEFDDNTDFDTAIESARGKSCVLGNVAVSEVMTYGTP